MLLRYNRMKKTLVSVLVIPFMILCVQAFSATSDYSLEFSTLGRCKILIASPTKKWNKNILIVAHGQAYADRPLSAHFNAAGSAYLELLKSGWMIASTSYHSNGPIGRTALPDIVELRDYLVKRFGKPNAIYMSGQSSGGSSAVGIAESYPNKFDGLLAVSANLSSVMELNNNPKSPIVFLQNQDEVIQVKRYISNIPDDAIKPALWYVARDGHGVILDSEWLAAFRALLSYKKTGKIELNKNTTSLKSPVSTAVFKDGGAYGKVWMGSVYCEMYASFTKADMQKLKILPNTQFIMKSQNQKITITYLAAKETSSEGLWQASLSLEQFLKLTFNGSNSLKALGWKSNDKVFIKKI